jgi:hypothetical protein
VIGLDLRLNGDPLCLASVDEPGALTTVISAVAPAHSDASTREAKYVNLHVGGRSGRHTYTWTTDQELKVGDVVEVRIVELESADDSIKAARVESDPEGIPGWFDDARAKHKKTGG